MGEVSDYHAHVESLYGEKYIVRFSSYNCVIRTNEKNTQIKTLEIPGNQFVKE